MQDGPQSSLAPFRNAGAAPPPQNRVIVVATRAPTKPLSGGMAPAVREATLSYDSVVWYALGQHKKMREAFERAAKDIKPDEVFEYDVEGFKVRQIPLDQNTWKGHYDLYCNSFVWPCCHDLPEYMDKPLTYDDTYANTHVNDLIADNIAEDLWQEDDTTSPIMIQDYHHFKLARLLRKKGLENPIIFFNHTPLPSPETFNALGDTEKREFKKMMTDLLHCDSIQFQTEQTARNFLHIIGQNNNLSIPSYKSIPISIKTEEGEELLTYVGHTPISINTEKVIKIASEDVTLKEESPGKKLEDQLVAEHILLNFERCDFSKGIEERIEAFNILMANEKLHGKVQLVLQAEPTRTDIPAYQSYAKRVNDLAEQINARQELWINGHPPVIFFNENIPNDDVIRLMRGSKTIGPEEKRQRRIGIITPFRDGMNLTAKEFAAAQDPQNANPLILSRGAGAAAELDMNGTGAVVYTPCKNDEQATLVEAMNKAINMEQEEANLRAGVMLKAVKENTIQRWGSHMIKIAKVIFDRRTRAPIEPGLEHSPVAPMPSK